MNFKEIKMSIQTNLNQHIPSQVSVHHVALLKPFHWLSLALQDINHHPAASLSHGLMVTLLILVTLVISSFHVYIIAAALTGFMLIGPIFSAALCELSHQSEQGKAVSFDSSIEGIKDKQDPLIHFSAILLGASFVWFLLSALVLLATVGDIAPSLEQVLWGNMFDTITPLQIAVYAAVGGLLACIVFVVTAVSVPAIIDHNMPALDAMAVSTKVTLENLPTMFVWAALIALLTGIAFATYLVGMIVIYPLLSHATWHAYRDLVENEA